MAVNNKTNVVINSYVRGKPPVLTHSQERYLQDELQRIEAAVRSLATGAVEVLDEPPANPVRGMLKYNISPWDPLGDSSEGLVIYDGSAWQNV